MNNYSDNGFLKGDALFRCQSCRRDDGVGAARIWRHHRVRERDGVVASEASNGRREMPGMARVAHDERRRHVVWAQLISVRVKRGAEDDVVRIMDMLRGIEQPNSGLIRHLVFRDQSDPQLIRTLALFESEEKARGREADPRRREVQTSAQAMMAQVIEGQPIFDNLDVLAEFTY